MISISSIKKAQRQSDAWEAITGGKYLFIRDESLTRGQDALEPVTHWRVLDLRCDVMDADRLICVDTDPLRAIERAMAERP